MIASTTSTTTRRPIRTAKLKLDDDTLVLDGATVRRESLPRYLQALDDRALRGRLVVGFVQPRVLRTR